MKRTKRKRTRLKKKTQQLKITQLKNPQLKRPPTEDEPQKTEDINCLSSNTLLDNIEYFMTQISGELPDLGENSDSIFPLHTSTPKHVPESMVKVAHKKREVFQCIKDDLYVLKLNNQAEVENGITQELEDWECELRENAIREVNQNYMKIPKSRKKSLIKRIGWQTKYIK